jgi:EamA domain-containing membrane protein RarD
VTAASTYAFVNPVVAVTLGAVVLGEQVTPLTLVAATLIVGAVVLLLIGQSRNSAPAVVLETPIRDVAGPRRLRREVTMGTWTATR